MFCMDFVIEDIPVVSLLDVLGLEQFSVCSRHMLLVYILDTNGLGSVSGTP